MRLIDADKLEPIEVGIDEMSFLAVDYEDVKNAPTIEPRAKAIAQITFDEDKLREIVHEAVERFKEEYDIVDNPDAEIVVRCKDCYKKETVNSEEGTCFYWCLVHGHATDEWRYCDYGERKESK